MAPSRRAAYDATMTRVCLERMTVLAQRYLDALGPLDAPLGRIPGTSLAELELELHALSAGLIELPETWDAETAHLVRHTNALLARARGRLQHKLPNHPDILAGVRARLRGWKAAWRHAAPTAVEGPETFIPALFKLETRAVEATAQPATAPPERPAPTK